MRIVSKWPFNAGHIREVGMSRTMSLFRTPGVLAFAAAALLAWPAAASAQTVSGSAAAIQATVLGVTSVLGDTGALADAQDLREASSMSAAIPSLGGADVLHAATGSSITDGAGDVSSEASLA